MWRSEIPLRDYQVDALDSIEDGFKRHRSLLISVPTGGGKTVIFNTYAFSKGMRTLVVAHRDELIWQALDKYVMVGGKERETGKIIAGRIEVGHYTAGSIQTIYRNMEKLEDYFRSLDLVVWDEAHHVPARTYREVYRRIKEVNPEVKMLGATATPFRADKQNLKEFFEEMAFSIGILDLIRLGYLVPLRGRRLVLGLDLDSIAVRRDDAGNEDFSARALGKAILESGVLPEVVKKWIELAGDRRTIFFLPSVESSKALVEEFTRAKVRAQVVHAGMSLEERRHILQKFKNGEIRVIANVNVLTEGFDDPEVDCIGLIRPTKSLVLYAQMVGRGLRLAKGKRDCLLLDFTGVSRKHDIVGLDALFGLEEKELAEVVKAGLMQDKEVAIGSGENLQLKVLVGEEKIEEFTYEGRDAVKYCTTLGDMTVLSCGLNGKVLVLVPENERYSIYLLEKEKLTKLKENLTQDYAWTVFNILWKQHSDDFMLWYAEKALNEPPTVKQLNFLIKQLSDNKLPIDLKKLSKLHATNIIAMLIAVSRLKE